MKFKIILFTSDLPEQVGHKPVFHVPRIFFLMLVCMSLKCLCLRPLPLCVCTNIAQRWPAFLKLGWE